VLLEFGSDLKTTFVVPKEGTSSAAPSPLDAAIDACDNKSGDVAIAGCTTLISNNPNCRGGLSQPRH